MRNAENEAQAKVRLSKAVDEFNRLTGGNTTTVSALTAQLNEVSDALRDLLEGACFGCIILGNPVDSNNISLIFGGGGALPPSVGIPDVLRHVADTIHKQNAAPKQNPKSLN